MKFDLDAFAQQVTPLTEDEARVYGALEWLEGDVPPRIREHFIRTLECVLERVLPEEQWKQVAGCDDPATYMAAFDRARADGLFKPKA